jgi:hypothetical protein
MGLSALLADRQTSASKHRPSYVFMLLYWEGRPQLSPQDVQCVSLDSLGQQLRKMFHSR